MFTEFEIFLKFCSNCNTEEVRKTVIGLARDLRGIAFAFNTKTSYMMLFDWIYPAYTPVLQRAVEIWYQDPQVTTPVLKLFAELVQNRSQRLQFDVSSPNGILLFREASKIICTYGKYYMDHILMWLSRGSAVTQQGPSSGSVPSIQSNIIHYEILNL